MGTENDIPLVGANEYDEDEDCSFFDQLGGIFMAFAKPFIAAYKFVAGW